MCCCLLLLLLSLSLLHRWWWRWVAFPLGLLWCFMLMVLPFLLQLMRMTVIGRLIVHPAEGVSSRCVSYFVSVCGTQY